MTSSLWEEFAWRQVEDPGPPTEHPGDGSPLPRPASDEWGQSDSLDPDNVGDIADEGVGHRG